MGGGSISDSGDRTGYVKTGLREVELSFPNAMHQLDACDRHGVAPLVDLPAYDVLMHHFVQRNGACQASSAIVWKHGKRRKVGRRYIDKRRIARLLDAP